MQYNKEKFFTGIRGKLFAMLTQAQVDRLNAYLVYAEGKNMIPAQLAYVLATVYHETGVPDGKGGYSRFMPVEETGRGKGRPYSKKVKYNGNPYTSPDKIYYGRGDVQLTWYDNYERAEKVLKIPGLLATPEMALQYDVAMKIAVDGMSLGFFTGKKLSNYITATSIDFAGARRIINGQDKADQIAGYARIFLAAFG